MTGEFGRFPALFHQRENQFVFQAVELEIRQGLLFEFLIEEIVTGIDLILRHVGRQGVNRLHTRNVECILGLPDNQFDIVRQR